MLKLAALIVALTPALSLADKNFVAGTGGTHDCADDPIVNIAHGEGTYTITGACKEINVSGDHLHLLIAETGALMMNGSGNEVSLGAVRAILVNGDGNRIRWKTAKGGPRPSTDANGSDNTIEKSP